MRIARAIVLVLSLTTAAARAADLDVIEKMMVSSKPVALDEVREKLWSSPIGLLLNEYLFDGIGPAEATRRAHRLTRRTFSSAPLVLPRLSALRIMIQDGYQRGLVSPEGQVRVAQLESLIAMNERDAKNRVTHKLITALPEIVLFSFVSGSAVVRNHAGAAIEDLVVRLNPWSKTRALEGPPSLYDQRFQSLVRREFFSEYSYTYASNTFLSTYLSTALIYDLFEDGAQEGDGFTVRFWNYLLQTHTALEKL